MFAALALVAAVATPSPAPVATDAAEPNHVTIAGSAGSGFSAQAFGLYEFQATPHLRLSDELHWGRLSARRLTYDEYDDEVDVELGPGDLPTGVGVGYLTFSPLYSPRLAHMSGWGIGVDRWPNWGAIAAPYFTLWYYPSVTSGQAGTPAYGVLRANAGYNVRAGLANPWGFQIGVEDESWFAANGRARSTNVLSPYVSVTWWQ
jgi:hypothetical protein